METHIQATEDALIDTLSFKLPNTANFINDRRSVTFYPAGSNDYGPRGVKVIKFMLTGTDWLDPSTVRIQFTEGFGHDLGLNDFVTSADFHSGTLAQPPGIPGNQSRIVMFPLLCGLFNPSKCLPLRYLQGLQIELEVVSIFLMYVLKGLMLIEVVAVTAGSSWNPTSNVMS